VKAPLSLLVRLSAVLFLPIRRLTGPLHRRRRSLSDDEEERERVLPPLPPPWSADDRWYRGDSPPRRHNQLTPLPHGDAYFADLIPALEAAEQRITIAGWCLTPLMDLAHGQGKLVAELLREASMHAEVYVILWSGAPAFFEPDIHYVERVRRTLLRIAPRVRCELDRRAKFSHDHHQKAVTIDGRIAYVGGIDLTTFQGDRWDSPAHPLRFGPSWHDIQIRLEGEVVRDVEENFCQRWNAVTGDRLTAIEPVVDPAWDTPAQLLRTVPAGFYGFAPFGIHGIRHAVLHAIEQAQHFIYLENQYLWAPEVVDALRDAMDRHRGQRFRIVIVLPARAYSGRYDNDLHVRSLRDADRDGTAFEAYSLYSGGPGAGTTGFAYHPIYVHAKIAVIDDEWFAVGSANLNRRGLATDTEIAVQSPAPEIARQLRIQLWSEHLGLPEEQIAGRDPIDLIDHQWKSIAAERYRCLLAGTPPTPGQVVRYVADTHPLGRLLDRVQSATLEH
jgi:phosphatidylserine/phosphatidylglycerophosphate/cardiolipin synthase-like enzyme